VLPILALAILAGLAFTFSDSPESIMPLLLTFLLALQRLSTRLRGVAGSLTQLIDNSAKVQRLNSILDVTDKQFSLVEARYLSHFKLIFALSTSASLMPMISLLHCTI
jgi:ATP-binding cassette subfamily B protein/subfamily B ATP-binding cassette protein MsbA